jgi:hypothetical protein
MKENLTGNSLFKLAIVIIGLIYLALYYNQTLNGRYRVVDKNNFPPTIIDTRTGIYYCSNVSNREVAIMVDQVKGIMRGVPIKLEKLNKIPTKK